MPFKDFWYFNKRKIFISLLIFIFIGLSIFSYFYYDKIMKKAVKISKKTNKKVVTVERLEVKEKGEKVIVNEPKKNNNKVVVDVKGMIQKPGVFELEEGKRVIDAINLAGGFLAGADTSMINLSKKLSDQMVIVIYSKVEVDHFDTYLKNKLEKEALCNKLIENNACMNSINNQSKVSINNGSLEELTNITGIGKSKAEAIIKRRKVKPFNTLEELKEVEGIGEALFAKIKESITL